MARTASTRGTRGSRGKKSTGIRVDLSNISKAFEPSQEYAVRITEASVEDGNKAPYFNLKLQGLEGSEFESSVMYHRASTAEQALWRLRPLLEAFAFEIPDGPLDLDAEDFVGREAMCSTYLDRYEGGSSVKPDEFWPLDEQTGGKKEEESDFDLDDIDDEGIESLAEELEVKGRTVKAKRKALADLDQDDVAEAWAKIGGGDSGEEDEALDLDELEDDDLLAIAEHLELKVTTARKAKTALAKHDEEEVAEAWAEIQEERAAASKKKPADKKASTKDKKAGGKKKAVSEEDIQEMNEDELEEVNTQFDLDLDLSEMKTLRKMKNAVIDAMEEGGHFDS